MIYRFRRGKKIIGGKKYDADFVKFEETAKLFDTVSDFCPGEILAGVGDKVKIGSPLSDRDGFVTHSPLSGVVTKIDGATLTIENDKELSALESVPYGIKSGKTLSELECNELIGLVAGAGVIEADSTVLTHTLLEGAKGKVKTLVINAVCTEDGDLCPSYIVTNYSDKIISSMKIIMSAMGIKEGIIALSAIDRGDYEALVEKTKKTDMIRCERLSEKYPQQHPSLVVYALSGRELSPLGDSRQAGFLMLSAASCLDIYNIFAKGQSYCTDLVTLEKGKGQYLICALPRGASPREIKRIFGIEGSLGTSSPLSRIPLAEGEKRRPTRIFKASTAERGEGPCVMCGECDAICPMYLFPYEFISKGALHAKAGGVMVCIECGLCESVCPSEIALLSKIRKAKNDIKTKGEGGKA